MSKPLAPLRLVCVLSACAGWACSSTGSPPTEEELLAARPYSVTVPPDYVAGQKRPLLLVLAGYGSSGLEASQYLGFPTLAPTAGFFLVSPDGLRDSFGFFAWHPGADHASNSWDVEYLLAIVHDLQRRYDIDADRVYFAGHSQGAHMAHRMACDGAGEVAAIMSLAGQVSKSPTECAPTRPVSVVQVHGDQDNVIGYYGDVQNHPPDPSVPSAHETVAVWARNDGCTGAIALTGATLDLDQVLPGDETTVEAYAGCPPGLAVELWTIVGGSHRPSLTPDFASIVWGFLSAHPRR